MKILTLCYEFPPVGGGGGRVARQVAAGLVQRGHEVRLVTAGLKHLPRRETQDGVLLLRPESFRKKEDTCTVPEMGLYVATALLPILREARQWRPDVIHAHFAVPTGPLALAAHLATGIPYVLTAHLGDVPGGVPEQTAHLYRLLNPFIRPVWKRAAALTAVSHFVGGLAHCAYAVDPVIIPNGMEPVAAPDLSLKTPRRIVMAGRLSIQKNPLLALESLALIKDLPWEFHVIGEGPLGQDMRAAVGRHALTDRITFHGWQSPDQVAQIMGASDILLMPSLHEGLPMVAIEALMRGLALVGSAIGGLQDVIDEGSNGFFCELRPEPFASRLRELLTNDSLLAKMRQASREKSADFALDKTIDSYERVLKDAAVTKPSA
ncbi:glycosyltransferase [soil metagenome]